MQPRVLRAGALAALTIVVVVIVFQVRAELLPHGVGGRRLVACEAGQPGLQRAVAGGAALLADRILVAQVEDTQ